MGAIPFDLRANPVDLRELRDDGHLSAGLGRLVAAALPPLLPAVVGACVTMVLLVAGLGFLTGITLFAPVTALLLAGVGSGHPHDGRFDWMVPPVLRGTEYLYLLALGYGSGVPGPLVFVLLAVVTLYHGEIVRRTRAGVPPPAWVRRAALGWDGRMLLVAAGGALVNAVPFAFGALAGYLGALLVVETAASWLATPVAVARDGRNEWGGADASTS